MLKRPEKNLQRKVLRRDGCWTGISLLGVVERIALPILGIIRITSALEEAE